MKTKHFLWLLFLGFMILLSFPVLAFDRFIYQPSTIDIEFNKIETDHQDNYDSTNNGKKPTHTIIIHPMVPFTITGQYLNNERDLSEDNKRGLDVFAKTFQKPEALDVYKHEILVRDSDNREYWLPIQENFIDAFHKEYFQDCKLTLYLLISIIYDHKPLVLINEFLVQEADSDYLKNGPFFDIQEFSRYQTGFRYETPIGTIVRAVKNGTINRLSDNPFNQTNLGKFVELEHHQDYLENGVQKAVTFYTIYAFLSEISVEKGDIVFAGAELGKTGKSGPLANQDLQSEFLFCLYSYEDESILEKWTQSKPINMFGVYWYNPVHLFK